MKFCPECGRSLENITKCVCGYDKETNKIDRKVNDTYNKNNNMIAREDSTIEIEKYIIDSARKMNIDKNITDKDLLDNIKGVHFNTDGCFTKDYINELNMEMRERDNIYD